MGVSSAEVTLMNIRRNKFDESVAVFDMGSYLYTAIMKLGNIYKIELTALTLALPMLPLDSPIIKSLFGLFRNMMATILDVSDFNFFLFLFLLLTYSFLIHSKLLS